MTTWIVFGKSGQLAQALARQAFAHGINLTMIDRNECDMSKEPGAIKRFLKDLPNSYSGIINTSAYTNVDLAETEPEAAYAINTRAPALIAELCRSRNWPFIQISSDYVFSGTAVEPYKPDDPVNPINWYGVTKADSESLLELSGANALIVRTSWVFDGLSNNFFTKMLALAESCEKLSIVADQVGRPTYSVHLADCVLALAKLMTSSQYEQKYRRLHATGSGEPVSWADFARAIFEMTNLEIVVDPISSLQFNAPAKRPAYSVLDMSELTSEFKITLPNWRLGLASALIDQENST